MANEGTADKPLLAEIGAEEARRDLGELLSRAGFGGERILITRHGKPIAGLVSIEDVERLQRSAAA